MAILTRIAKGTALTHTEMDANFKELDYRLHILASAPQITTDIDDGVLDEAAWNLVEWTTDYLEFQPDVGTAPSEQTKMKIIYDDKNQNHLSWVQEAWLSPSIISLYVNTLYIIEVIERTRPMV